MATITWTWFDSDQRTILDKRIRSFSFTKEELSDLAREIEGEIGNGNLNMIYKIEE